MKASYLHLIVDDKLVVIGPKFGLERPGYDL